MRAFLRKIIEIIKWIMNGIWYALERLFTNSEDEAPQEKRYKQYGLSQIRQQVQEHDLYESRLIFSLEIPHFDLSLRERQQEDIYKDRAMRFIKSLPIGITREIVAAFGWLNDPVRIIEASHNEGYIPNEYIMLFAANETVDLSEKICLFTALFNIVKTTQDEITNKVDTLETKVAEQNQKIDVLAEQNHEIKAQNQAQKQKLDALAEQNQEIIQMLRGMQRSNQQSSAQNSISP